MRRGSTSLAVGDMPVRTAVSWYSTPIRMETIKNILTTTNGEKDVAHSHVSGGMKMVPFWKTVESGMYSKTKYTITIGPKTALLGTCPRKRNAYVHTKTSTQMSIASLSGGMSCSR